MQITINIDAALLALNAVAGVCPARSPKAILMNVLMEVDPEGASFFLATDLEIGVRFRLIGVKADAPCRLILNPTRLKSILELARSRNEDLVLKVTGDGDSPGVRVSGLGCRYDLPLEDDKLFPEVPSFTATDFDEVGGADLVTLINRTSYATDVCSTRYALGGTLLEFTPDGLTGVATDGRRLSRMTTQSAPTGKGAAREGSTVVPVKAMKLLAKVCRGDEATVRISVASNHAMFGTDSASVFSRLVEGRFPNYRDVFSGTDAITSKATFEAGVLLSAFRQASITTGEESRGVECRFEEGRVTMNATAADMGASEIVAELEFVGPPVQACYDARYILDILQAMDPKEPMTLACGGDKVATLMKAGDAFDAVVMPLTRDR